MSRSHETVIDIRATPDEVFRAVTDAEQIVKWFAPIAKVEPGVGGSYSVSWGPGMEIKKTIHAWEPGKHFGTYSDRSMTYGSDGKPVETGETQRLCVDVYIEALGGGMTRLRLVQSGFGSSEAWDGEFESTKSGWRSFIEKLKEVLEQGAQATA